MDPKKALRDAIVLTDALAIGAVLYRLLSTGWWPLAVLILAINLAVTVLTWLCLSERKSKKASA